MKTPDLLVLLGGGTFGKKIKILFKEIICLLA